MGIGKALSITILGIVSVATVISGLWFTSYSISNHNYLLVFGNKIPGFVFGVVIVYIGVKSVIRLYRLNKKLHQPDVIFSWQNFVRK